MVRLEFDCRLRYPSGFVLEGRFEASDGVTALFGPSGSGKSTVLALIAGVLQPDAGAIRLCGRALVDRAAGVLLSPERRQVGIVFQDHLLFPHLSVRENLRFGQGRQPARPMSFERVVEVLELGHLLERRPAALSGGQRQRVALGRALLRGPELLLMDEPLTAVDEVLRERILTYLERAVAEWHIPTLFVSHAQADVRRLADRVVLLDAGRVSFAGPTAEALGPEVLGRLPGLAGPINLLRVTDLRLIAGHWEGQVEGARLHLPPGDYQAGGSVYVQFFPHDVMLGSPSPAPLSARNRLPGTVRQVLTTAGRTYVAVDAGQVLWAEVTPETVAEMHLAPGLAVACLFKATALEVVG
jgi:molybdate transport system ATP-binding protein